MTDERIYVLVPETVQVVVPGEFVYPELGAAAVQLADTTKTFPMVAGRLIAQGVHVGRLLGEMFAKYNMPYREITTIVLSVRNTKELRKVSDEVCGVLNSLTLHEKIPYEEFHDTNVDFYGTEDRVHTITAFGPVTPEIREDLEGAMGHLELYK